MPSPTDHIRGTLTELNLLGSAIFKEDPYNDFLDSYKGSLLDPSSSFETKGSVDFDQLQQLLDGVILPQIAGATPVVFLSGGIDSTVLADVLHRNNIAFEACSYFMSEEDPAIRYVEYLEEKYDIKVHRIYLDYDRLRKIYDNYFGTYQSLNLDYAFLSMCHMVEEVSEKLSDRGPLVFLDGIEGDNLFGYRNDFKLRVRSQLLYSGAQLLSKHAIYPSRKLNIYSSTLMNNYALSSIYQNFIFVKLLDASEVKKVSDELALHTINTRGQNFHVQNMLGMLYYMGRRVGYKSYAPITLRGNRVLYPFTHSDILGFGFEIKNRLKLRPVIKAPLKYYLKYQGYDDDFVFSPKRGMGFDLFRVIEFDEVVEGVQETGRFLSMKSMDTCKSYLNSLYRQRDLAVDHYLFGLALGGKYIKERLS